MYVITTRARAISPEAAQEMCRTYSHFLRMHQEPGFLYGACAINVDDPADLFFFSRWGTREAAQRWFESEGFRRVVDKDARLRATPIQFEVFEICGE